ncbi:MFS general substrate transporter [Aureobasidium pullulans]|nr:MFS general substrate transporter [Aureobasidium pullulans]
MVTLTYLPETCRTVVGNGSVPPQKWNRTLWSFLRKKEVGEQTETLQRAKKRPNPFSSILIILKKEDGLILLYGAFLYAGFYVVLITLTDQLADRYGFNTLQIGLCYIPFGVGCMASRFSVGIFLDRNYKRLAQRLDPSISQNTTQDPENFPIEKARLQIGIPAAYASALSIIIYGWVMHFHTSLAGPLIMLFLIGNFTTGAFNVFSTLIVDINLHQPATASAANNLARCGMGAVFTAFAQPLVGAIGIGWTSTAVAGLWVVLSPCLWAVMVWGPKWRAEEKRKMEEKEEKK